jgi:hypothetical protein
MLNESNLNSTKLADQTLTHCPYCHRSLHLLGTLRPKLMHTNGGGHSWSQCKTSDLANSTKPDIRSHTTAYHTAMRYVGSEFPFDLYCQDGSPNFNELCDFVYDHYDSQGTPAFDLVFKTALELIQY